MYVRFIHLASERNPRFRESVGDGNFRVPPHGKERLQRGHFIRGYLAISPRCAGLNHLTWFVTYLRQVGRTTYTSAMSDDYVQGTLELSVPFERLWLPRRPLCCDDDYSQLRRRSRADALRYKHIEANPAAQVNMLVVDVDSSEGRLMSLWGHRGMLPNFIVENPANGHVHSIWALDEPVCRTDMARLKPLKLLHATTEGLRRSCDGDAGYAGLLMKNPECPAWNGELVREDAYQLDELRQALEESGDMPPASWRRTKRARTVGLGRNCAIFDEARTLAYRFVRTLPDRSTPSNEALRVYVQRTCHELNAALPDPLPMREVDDIAKSIHKWITTRSRMWRDGAVANAATFITIQSCRGRKSGEARRARGIRFAQEVMGQ